MCGIAGIISTDRNRAVSGDAVKKMADSMIRRGPDAEGFFIKDNVVFGHRRLSIIDLSERGKQPMSNEDGSLWITFNGEIYNFKKIKNELKNKHRFRSESDTEVILHAFEEWGLKCLEKFRGMFAFAIFDFKNNQLFLARDHVGQKPLIYYFDKSRGLFYFASEIRAILEALPQRPKIYLRALHLYFLHNFRHIPHPYTIFEGIYKLPPASWLIFKPDKNEIEIAQYWQPSFLKESPKKESEYIEEYQELAKQCINLTEVSDVPVGLLLSGGIDSSTICSLLKNKDVRSYSIGFSEDDEEFLRARKIARLFGTKHHEIMFASQSLEDTEELIKTLGEPLNLLPAAHIYRITKEAGRDLKVLIGGNGADEIFYGYDGSNRLLLFSKFLKILPLRFTKGDIYRKKGRILKESLYQDLFREALIGFNEGKIVDDYFNQANSENYIEKSYFAGLMSENQHSVTIISDLGGMMNSVEIRAPFLDHKIVEFAAKLPVNLKVKSVFTKKYNKYIMRKAMERILPLDLIWAKKMGLGYNIRLPDLIRNQWQNYVKDILFGVIPETHLFNQREIERNLKIHLMGRQDKSALLWGLVTFGIWYKNFIV